MKIRETGTRFALSRKTRYQSAALGAVYLADLSTGAYRNAGKLSKQWRAERRFMPTLSRAKAPGKMERWELEVREGSAEFDAALFASDRQWWSLGIVRTCEAPYKQSGWPALFFRCTDFTVPPSTCIEICAS